MPNDRLFGMFLHPDRDISTFSRNRQNKKNVEMLPHVFLNNGQNQEMWNYIFKTWAKIKKLILLKQVMSFRSLAVPNYGTIRSRSQNQYRQRFATFHYTYISLICPINNGFVLLFFLIGVLRPVKIISHI